MSDANIQQRVFDAMPRYPVPISIFGLYVHLNCDRRSIQNAIAALKADGLIEPVTGTKFTYRVKEGAQRPQDGRGWPHGKPRPCR